MAWDKSNWGCVWTRMAALVSGLLSHCAGSGRNRMRGVYTRLAGSVMGSMWFGDEDRSQVPVGFVSM